MATAPNSGNVLLCNCCIGISQETPQVPVNRPGLNAIAYRVGAFQQFRDTLLARLQLSRQPFLAQLKARENDDFSIALLDSFSTVADVLTFYTERYQNEAYLLTATERRSILELAALIGYELRPGVAAGTFLAFTIDPTAGAYGAVLNPMVAPPSAPAAIAQLQPGSPLSILVDLGTKVQSIPGPGEKPQTFETIEPIFARAEWNAMAPLLSQPQVIDKKNTLELFLNGAVSNLKVGDKILLIPNVADLKHIAVRSVMDVKIQPDGQSTLVHLEGWHPGMTGYVPSSYSLPSPCPKGSPTDFPAETPLNSSTAAEILSKTWDADDLVALAKTQQWSLDDLSNALNQRLNDPQVYPRAHGTAFVLRQQVATFGHNAPLYKSLQPSLRVETKFDPGFGSPKYMKAAYPHNWENWTLATYGGSRHIYLDSLYPAILAGSYIVLQRRLHGSQHQLAAQVASNTEVAHTQSTLSAKVSLLQLKSPAPLTLFPIRRTSVLCQSEPLDLAEVPINDVVSGNTIYLDRAYVGLLEKQALVISGERSDLPGVTVAEIATLDTIQIVCGVTAITLHEQLSFSYKRATVKINANVALATHGETVKETLGNGDGSQAFQSFALHQSPLTYISSDSASGTQSTLQVRVNDLLWTEVPFFYGHGPDELIYIVRQDNNGVSTVTFGDGVTGSRLPTGSANITATYRFGIGAVGEVRANQLSMLAVRPLGVRGVNNPLAATGGADPENLDDARQNATLTIRTLDRVVSLQDYQDFARAFAGIAKALATWSWNNEQRIVLLTIAGANGEVIDPAGTLAGNLLSSIAGHSEPGTIMQLLPYQPRFFKISGNVDVDPKLLLDDVKTAIETRLRTQFSFASRQFGQPVHFSEVIAAIQNVPGVVHVDLTQFYRSDLAPSSTPEPHIPAALPQVTATGFSCAELLTLDPAPLSLTEAQNA